jgi:hypothetical protein
VLFIGAQGTGCSWTAQSDASWLSVYPTGSGSGAIAITVYPTFRSVLRQATLDIAGVKMLITQSGSPASEVERFIRLLYFSVLGRLPSSAEVAAQLGSRIPRRT